MEFLSTLLNILPAVQAKQINELINNFKNTGQIRNLEEYKSKLQELSSIINSINPKPSFQPISAISWNLCSSDAHNLMVKSVKNDIEACFEQVDDLGKKIDDYYSLFLLNIIDSIERNIKEQENTITRLEWLADQRNEFTRAIVNKFDSSKLFRTSRSEFGNQNLYFDNRSLVLKDELELPNAVVSEHGKKLILQTTRDALITATSVKLLSNKFSYNSQVYSETNNDISNIIDGKKDTFWSYSTYLDYCVDKVFCNLELNLGQGKDITYIVVESYDTNFSIESITGITPENNRITIVSENTIVDKFCRIDFPKQFVKSIIVSLSTNTYTRIEKYPQLNYDSFDSTTINEITKNVVSPNLSKIINLNNQKKDILNYYKYCISIDNIWFGNSLYNDVGIFVSEPLEITDPGVVAVNTKQLEETSIIRNSIEYEIIKIDSLPKLKTISFPISRINETKIYSERLILNKRKESTLYYDVGMLRFCPLITDTKEIIVYKNGIPLTCGEEWQFAIYEEEFSGIKQLAWQTSINIAEDFSNYKLYPQKMYIFIPNVDNSAVYTIDYYIRYSDSENTNENIWLDKEKTIYIVKGNKIIFSKNNPNYIPTCKLYLQVTLRRNSSQENNSPELYEYTLLANSYEG